MTAPAAPEQDELNSSRAAEFIPADSFETVSTRYRIASGRVNPSARWALRVAVWLAVAATFALALHYDIRLMRWRYIVFPEGPNGILKQIFYGFRDFGQVLPILAAILIVARLDKARRRAVIASILIAQILAGIAYNAGKLTIARYRPYAAVERVSSLDEMRLEQTWVGLSPGNRDDGLQSFPSGHSAGAFAFAGVLAWFYPRLACVLWPLAVGCALSRYVDGVHWLSDCVIGAAIGYAGAWLALRPHLWAAAFLIIRRRKVKRTGAA